VNIAILSRNRKLHSTRRLSRRPKSAATGVRVIDPLRCYNEHRPAQARDPLRRRKLGHFDAVIPRIGASVTFYGTAVVGSSR